MIRLNKVERHDKNKYSESVEMIVDYNNINKNNEIKKTKNKNLIKKQMIEINIKAEEVCKNNSKSHMLTGKMGDNNEL